MYAYVGVHTAKAACGRLALLLVCDPCINALINNGRPGALDIKS